GWKCDCPSIIICISVIRSLNGRGLFHATSLSFTRMSSGDLKVSRQLLGMPTASPMSEATS
ncbi:hypothetical protein, partial [Rhizobium leguminosarum]|uniref:hypothetical protein n=1 Tax=Rhizobium leguminosarum TaxID=384 RepID=UPI00198126DD